jgi:hypothetical protein
VAVRVGLVDSAVDGIDGFLARPHEIPAKGLHSCIRR